MLIPRLQEFVAILLCRHPQSAVDAEDRAVEHGVGEDVLDQGREFLGPAETGRKGNLRLERLPLLVGPACIMGVSKMPGAMETTRMPKRPSSRAAGNVIEATPPFEAA